MKALIIGFGSIGQRHYQNLKKIYKEKILINVFREKGKKIIIKDNKIVKNKKFSKFYKGKIFKDLIAALTPKPNMVLICNPSKFHEKYIRLCIKKNINFFVEKPALVSSKNIKFFSNKIKNKKLVTMVGFQQRFNPIIKDIKNIISKHTLGPVINANFQWHTYLPDHHKYENYKNSYAAKNELGGGVTYSLIHEIDLMQLFLGMPKSVIAIKNSIKKISINAEENIQAFFKFKNKDNNFSCSLSLSFSEKGNSRHFKIIFKKGSIICDLENNNYIVYKKNKIIKKKKIKQKRNELFLEEIRSYVESVKKSRESDIPFLSGSKSVLIAEKILESSKKLRELKINV